MTCVSPTWSNLLRLNSGTLFDTRPFDLLDRLAGKPVPLMCAYGGGVNSTAGLILLEKIGIIPDAILFADTGDHRNGQDAEKPPTYAYVDRMSAWCVDHGFPEIVWVRRDVDHDKQIHSEKYNTLEQECRVKFSLPSIAYYGRSCSQKWKHAPQDKWINNWPMAQEWRANGGKVLKAIFYDADEPERVQAQSNSGYQNWYPLLDYDWGRYECLAAIELASLPPPPKSSCFFCPEMTPEEIFQLQQDHPELLQRALDMEKRAKLTSIKGLGKHEFSWNELIAGRVPLDVIDRANGTKKLNCMCFDGE